MSKANARWTVASSGSVIQARLARRRSARGRLGLGGIALGRLGLGGRRWSRVHADGGCGRFEPFGRRLGAVELGRRVSAVSGSLGRLACSGSSARGRSGGPATIPRRARGDQLAASAQAPEGLGQARGVGIAIVRASWQGSAARPVPGRRESRDGAATAAMTGSRACAIMTSIAVLARGTAGGRSA